MIKKINLIVMLMVMPVNIVSMQSSRMMRVAFRATNIRYPMGGIIGANHVNNDSSSNAASNAITLVKLQEQAVMVAKNVENQLALSEASISIVTLDDFIKDMRDGSPIYSNLSEWQKMNLLRNLYYETLNNLNNKK